MISLKATALIAVLLSRICNFGAESEKVEERYGGGKEIR